MIKKNNSYYENDIAMRTYAYEKAEALYKAIGAVQTWRTLPYPSTHNLETNKMSKKAKDGVVNRWGRSYDIKIYLFLIVQLLQLELQQIQLLL